METNEAKAYLLDMDIAAINLELVDVEGVEGDTLSDMLWDAKRQFEGKGILLMKTYRARKGQHSAMVVKE